LYAYGIWRRRATPSRARRASECIRTVRGEIPSRSAISTSVIPLATPRATSCCRGDNRTGTCAVVESAVIAKLATTLPQLDYSSTLVNGRRPHKEQSCAMSPPARARGLGALAQQQMTVGRPHWP
jgi:hypothetical protein